MKVMGDMIKFYKTKSSVAKDVQGFEIGLYLSLNFQRVILEPWDIYIKTVGNIHMMC